MAKIHIRDHLILPFGTATKADIQKIALSAVAANGIYMTADVPIIYIDKSRKWPLNLQGADDVFPNEERNAPDYNEGTCDQWMAFFRNLIRSYTPNPTKYELMFLDHYFTVVAERATLLTRDHWQDVFNALLPIPEMQVYVHDPLSDSWSFEPDNNFRVDFGFWTGTKLVAVEIDGGEPSGYARDIRRDRLLRRADIDVIHILNLELERYGKRAVDKLLPREITWPRREEGKAAPPSWIPF